MTLNLLDLSSLVNNSYQGVFNSSITTDIYGTSSSSEMLETEKRIMDTKTLIEDLKLLLVQRYDNKVELLAEQLGITPQEIYNFLDGNSEPVPKIVQEIEKDKSNKYGDNIQIGGNRIEINNNSAGVNNHYGEMLKGVNNETLEKLKIENTSLKKMLKEKDKLIEALQQNIKLLKEKQ